MLALDVLHQPAHILDRLLHTLRMAIQVLQQILMLRQHLSSLPLLLA
jgi:hypothetical protein